MGILDYIYQQVLSEDNIGDTGLLTGKMGRAIFLFEYARQKESKVAEDKAYDLLQEVLNSLAFGKSEKNLGLTNGLFGIGCGIHYLFVNDFFSIEDADDFFSAFDHLAMSIANNYPPIVIGYEGMVAVALYMLRRISCDTHHGRAVGLLKEHFIYLIDRLQELQFTTSGQEEQVLSLLLEINRYGYYKTRVETMIKRLMARNVIITSFPKVQGYAGIGLQILNKTVL
ncbi:MAG: hypothetical protein IJ290_09340 [Bacteroidaceae bacterium]|nr:hypothetical protein [Bacteroidaceae bacterium]